MLELILQLFGGRGSGSGNKGGTGGGGKNAFGVQPTGDRGKYSVGDLVKSGKVFAADDDRVTEHSEPIVSHAVAAVYKAVDSPKSMKFLNSDGKSFTVVVQSTSGDKTAIKMQPGTKDGKSGVVYGYKDKSGKLHKGFASGIKVK